MSQRLARLSWCTLGLVTCLMLAGCRCGAARRPAAGTASQPASAPKVGAADLRARQLRALDQIVAGRGDLAAFHQGLPAHNAAMAGAGQPMKVDAALLQRAFRENFELLSACRALVTKRPERCSDAAPLGPEAVAGCQRSIAIQGLFRTVFVEKKCDEPALAPAAPAIGMRPGEVVAMCEAATRSDPARCQAAAASVRVLCEALASKDEAKCQAEAKGRGECEKNFKLMRALLAGDRAAIPQDPGMAVFASLLLDQPADCDKPFFSAIRRHLE